DCSDGTTAGAVVLKKFPDAQLFPMAHNGKKEDLDPVLNILDSETEIYTVDCVLGVKEILALGYKVTSLDHHIGAKEEFENIAKQNPNFTFVFDNNKSGASLAWTYFFPDRDVPEFIKLVEDGDLFIMKYDRDTIDVGNYLSMYRDDPKTVLGFIEQDLGQIKEKGSIISLYADIQINNQLKLSPINIKIGDYVVPAYCISSDYRSVCGSILSGTQNKAVSLFGIDGENVKISFRSKDGQTPSALELATILGGGGHNKAAAVFISLKKFLSMIVQD
ncbi:MAG: DHH family phosphoesterase, partial [Nitrospira sp.]